MAIKPVVLPVHSEPTSGSPLTRSIAGSRPVGAQSAENAAITAVRPDLEEQRAQETAEMLAHQVTESRSGSLGELGTLDPEKVSKLLEDG